MLLGKHRATTISIKHRGIAPVQTSPAKATQDKEATAGETSGREEGSRSAEVLNADTGSPDLSNLSHCAVESLLLAEHVLYVRGEIRFSDPILIQFFPFLRDCRF